MADLKDHEEVSDIKEEKTTEEKTKKNTSKTKTKKESLNNDKKANNKGKKAASKKKPAAKKQKKLTTMLKAELIEYAASKNIEINPKSTKAVIIQAIEEKEGKATAKPKGKEVKKTGKPEAKNKGTSTTKRKPKKVEGERIIKEEIRENKSRSLKKLSSFGIKKELIKETLKKLWFLPLGMLLVYLIADGISLFAFSGQRKVDIVLDLTYNSNYIYMAINLIAPIVIGFFVFKFIDDQKEEKRLTKKYSKKEIYLNKVISGLLILLVPILINTIALTIGSFMLKTGDSWVFLVCAFITTVTFFFTTILSIMVSEIRVMQIILTLIFSFLTSGLVVAFEEQLLMAFNGYAPGNAVWKNVNALTALNGFSLSIGEVVGYVCIIALIGVINEHLYIIRDKKKKKGIFYQLVKWILLWSISFILMSQVSFLISPKISLAAVYVVGLIVGIVSFLGCYIILNGRVKIISKPLLTSLSVFILTVGLFLGIISVYINNFEEKIPLTGEIEIAQVVMPGIAEKNRYIPEYFYYNKNTKGKDVKKKIDPKKKMSGIVYTTQDEYNIGSIIKIHRAMSQTNVNDKEYGVFDIGMAYYFKSGKTEYRGYNFNKSDTAEIAVVNSALNEIYKSDEFKVYYGIENLKYDIKKITIVKTRDGEEPQTIEILEDEYRTFVKALDLDFGEKSYFDELEGNKVLNEQLKGNGKITIEMDVPIRVLNSLNLQEGEGIIEIDISQRDKHTLAWLEYNKDLQIFTYY